MCFSSPSAPPPPPEPVKPQSAKAPDVNAIYSKRKTAGAAGSAPMTGGTLLTGPSGLAGTPLNTGKTLLGQ
jgi:hypothetical protein